MGDRNEARRKVVMGLSKGRRQEARSECLLAVSCGRGRSFLGLL